MKNKGVKRVLAMAVATVLVLETLPSVTVFAEETESTSVQEDLTEPQQAQREDRSNSWRYKDGTPILSDTEEYPDCPMQNWLPRLQDRQKYWERMKNLRLYLLRWELLSKSPTSLWRALRRPEPLTERFCS